MEKLETKLIFSTNPAYYDKAVRKMSGVLDEIPVINFIKNFRKSTAIVSLGIGTGRELEWLDEIKNISKIIGIDFAKSTLKFCRKRAKKCKKKIILLKDDMTNPVKLEKKVSKIKEPVIYISLINTLGNFSSKERELVFQRTKDLMKKKDRLVLCLYKRIDKAIVDSINLPSYLRPKSKKEKVKLTEIIEYALVPILWEPLLKKYNQLPRFWYNEKGNDLVVYMTEKKVFISHRFSKEEIKKLHKKAGLKIEKLAEGKAMCTVISKI